LLLSMMPALGKDAVTLLSKMMWLFQTPSYQLSANQRKIRDSLGQLAHRLSGIRDGG